MNIRNTLLPIWYYIIYICNVQIYYHHLLLKIEELKREKWLVSMLYDNFFLFWVGYIIYFVIKHLVQAMMLKKDVIGFYLNLTFIFSDNIFFYFAFIVMMNFFMDFFCKTFAFLEYKRLSLMIWKNNFVYKVDSWLALLKIEIKLIICATE